MKLESSLVWPKRLHWEKYLRPHNLHEALKWLEEFQGQARLLAGGPILSPRSEIGRYLRRSWWISPGFPDWVKLS